MYPSNAKSACPFLPVVLLLTIHFVLSFFGCSPDGPTVSFAVGTKQFTVNSADFAFGSAGNGMTFDSVRLVHSVIILFFFSRDATPGRSRSNNPFDILGDLFLKVH